MSYTTQSHDSDEPRASDGDEARLLELAMDQARDGVVIVDASADLASSTIRWCNASYANLAGLSRAQVTGSALAAVPVLQDVMKRMHVALRTDGAWQGELQYGPVDAAQHVAVQFSVVRDQRGETTHYVGVFRDITQSKRDGARLQHLAHHDPLTALPNRKLLMDRLHQGLARARRYKMPLAVLFIDLDGFKAVNDTLGHATGDAVLVMVAHRLGHLVRASDTVARLGGDEFVVLLPEVRALADAERVARKIITAISEVMQIDVHEVFVTPSVGLAVWPDHGGTIDDMLRRADRAMYSAKSSGKACFRTWSDELGEEARSRSEHIQALARAKDLGELHIDARPIIEVSSGQVAIEALLRWTRPGVGPVSPAAFLPLIPEAGLQASILPWMIRHASPGLQGTNLCLSLDVRPSWIQSPDAVAAIVEALDRVDLAPDRLWLEVAEAQLLDMQPQLIRQLETLRELGIRIIVDHYGTSHLSVPQLRSLPVDALKLDGALTRHVDADDALVRGLSTLCRSLGLDVIADGVAIQTQRDRLAELGVSRQTGPIHGRSESLAKAIVAWTPVERTS
ncbi:MAG: putative bifunctional diguanylate cyclase/phosphodiesterase [Myxococcota bacterium]